MEDLRRAPDSFTDCLRRNIVVAFSGKVLGWWWREFVLVCRVGMWGDSDVEIDGVVGGWYVEGD